jgi:hypothetical protein
MNETLHADGEPVTNNEYLAIILLGIGSVVLPVLGTAFGLVFTRSSRFFTDQQKRIAFRITLLPPLAAALIFIAVLSAVEGYLAIAPLYVLALMLVTLPVAAITAAIYLGVKLGRRS